MTAIQSKFRNTQEWEQYKVLLLWFSQKVIIRRLTHYDCFDFKSKSKDTGHWTTKKAVVTLGFNSKLRLKWQKEEINFACKNLPSAFTFGIELIWTLGLFWNGKENMFCLFLPSADGEIALSRLSQP